ncbi:MAG: FG-GAP-like repeat-containing protein [Planctomycetes bacterium]|nr:FG-GAP-like repeat-containing protein [Planctomycetota bacterium]
MLHSVVLVIGSLALAFSGAGRPVGDRHAPVEVASEARDAPGFAVRPRADGAFTASSASGRLVAVFRDGRVELAPFDADTPSKGWRLVLCTRAVGRGAPVALGGCQSATAAANRIEFDRGALIEWFVNDERGLEQGWTVHTRPEAVADEPLAIEVDVAGLTVVVASSADSACFVDSGHMRRVNYSGLRAWDARGRALDARLVPRPDGFTIEVDDRGATYPVVVDPLLGAPDWVIAGEQMSAHVGSAIAGAGDVDGDGFDDVLVGAEETPFSSEWGEARLYRGTSSGPSTTPAWTVGGTPTFYFVGSTAAGAGDVDGDGFDDVLVGGTDLVLGHLRVDLFLGSASGPSPTPSWSNGGLSPYQRIARHAAPAGDVNGDGFDDVLLTDGNFGIGEDNEGGAALYHGSAAGLSQVPAWSTESQQIGAFFGRSAASAGDVNGDGYDDVVVGAPEYDGVHSDEGRVFLYLGSATGLGETPAWSASGEHPNQYFGQFVAGVGDVDGDGYDDVAVSTPFADAPFQDSGKLWIYRGSPTGLGAAADWTLAGPTSFDTLGQALGRIGDFDVDGFADVLTMATPTPGAPEIRVYRGGANGPDWTDPFTAPVPQFTLSGGTVAGAGDVDGDGAADLLHGEPLYAGSLVSQGQVRSYSGVCGPLILEQPVDATVCLGSNTSLSVLAYSVTSYQWYRDGVPVGDGGPYSGATTSVLSIAGATAAEAGNYHCVLTRNCGSTSSAAALVTVDTLDTDQDGTVDCADGCPLDPSKIAPGTCGCGVSDLDVDSDGVADCVDNCAGIANPGQEDCNANDVGDPCDLAASTSLDVDGDLVPDDCEPGFGTPYCFGDGSGNACPCDNYGAVGAGCGNSVSAPFAGGALLYNFGGASVGADDTELYAVRLPKNKFGLIYLGSKSFPTGGLGTPFGDGLRCLGGTLQRFGARATGATGSLVELTPAGQFPALIVPGSTWHFQAWYRDPNGPCGGGFNLSNALRITFAP